MSAKTRPVRPSPSRCGRGQRLATRAPHPSAPTSGQGFRRREARALDVRRVPEDTCTRGLNVYRRSSAARAGAHTRRSARRCSTMTGVTVPRRKPSSICPRMPRRGTAHRRCTRRGHRQPPTCGRPWWSRRIRSSVRAILHGGRCPHRGRRAAFRRALPGPEAQPATPHRSWRCCTVTRLAKGGFEIVQLPQVESAFVAADSRDGAIRALVGGFDFNLNKFNHVTSGMAPTGSASSRSSTRRLSSAASWRAR